jgi:sarcosine oxidase delta subunit
MRNKKNEQGLHEEQWDLFGSSKKWMKSNTFTKLYNLQKKSELHTLCK